MLRGRCQAHACVTRHGQGHHAGRYEHHPISRLAWSVGRGRSRRSNAPPAPNRDTAACAVVRVSAASTDESGSPPIGDTPPMPSPWSCGGVSGTSSSCGIERTGCPNERSPVSMTRCRTGPSHAPYAVGAQRILSVKHPEALHHRSSSAGGQSNPAQNTEVLASRLPRSGTACSS